jgi:hypothetical protein
MTVSAPQLFCSSRVLSHGPKFLTEIFRLVWISLLAIGGGTVSLLLGELTTLRLIVAGAGLTVVLTLILVGWRLGNQVRMLVAALKLKEEMKESRT